MKQFFPKKASAYSLIEILIAISIVAIIMGFAVSSYTKYLAKQMVVNGINATSYLRQAVEDYYQEYGYLPGSGDLTTGPGGPYVSGYTLGFSDQPVYTNPEQNIAMVRYWNNTKYCSSGDANCNGTNQVQVEVTFSNPTTVASNYLSNKIFMLTSSLNAGAINWKCKPYDGGDSSLWLDINLLPKSCQ
ncbi:MAG: hypothetical protein RLZ35_369 [Pseudomonadota bacterium]